MTQVTKEVPEGMEVVEGFVADCNRETTPSSPGVEVFDKFLSTIPFRRSSRANTDEGMVLNVRLRGPRFGSRLPARAVVVRSSVTFPGNGSTIVMHHPLVVVAGTASLYAGESFVFSFFLHLHTSA